MIITRNTVYQSKFINTGFYENSYKLDDFFN
jgi:hypothetical protein